MQDESHLRRKCYSHSCGILTGQGRIFVSTKLGLLLVYLVLRLSSTKNAYKSTQNYLIPNKPISVPDYCAPKSLKKFVLNTMATSRLPYMKCNGLQEKGNSSQNRGTKHRSNGQAGSGRVEVAVSTTWNGHARIVLRTSIVGNTTNV